MKIRFLSAYTDPYDPARMYQPGWTAEVAQPDAERLIADGIAEQVSNDVRPTKHAYTLTQCVTPTAAALPLAGPIESRGEVTDLGGLIQGETYSAGEIADAEKRRGFSFVKAQPKK